MKKLAVIILMTFGLFLTAHADTWKWTDAYGDVHYVSTMTTIYTWLDEEGRVHYSDKPEHADAVSVELVWVSSAEHTVEQSAYGEGGDGEGAKTPERKIDPNESPAERLVRESAEAYYCKRATEIHNAYRNAPNLYRTNDGGEKEYLTEEEAAATLAHTEATVAQLCR